MCTVSFSACGTGVAVIIPVLWLRDLGLGEMSHLPEATGAESLSVCRARAANHHGTASVLVSGTAVLRA